MGGGADLRAEYDDQTEAEFRSEIYRQLEWIRFENCWKAGWTAWTYRELFGQWPPKWLNSLKPYPACEAVQKWVRRRIRVSAKEYRETKERERNNREQVSGSVASTPGANGLRRGNGKLEG